jgi:hypothetical protein
MQQSARRFTNSVKERFHKGDQAFRRSSLRLFDDETRIIGSNDAL